MCWTEEIKGPCKTRRKYWETKNFILNITVYNTIPRGNKTLQMEPEYDLLQCVTEIYIRGFGTQMTVVYLKHVTLTWDPNRGVQTHSSLKRRDSFTGNALWRHGFKLRKDLFCWPTLTNCISLLNQWKWIFCEIIVLSFVWYKGWQIAHSFSNTQSWKNLIKIHPILKKLDAEYPCEYTPVYVSRRKKSNLQ